MTARMAHPISMARIKRTHLFFGYWKEKILGISRSSKGSIDDDFLLINLHYTTFVKMQPGSILWTACPESRQGGTKDLLFSHKTRYFSIMTSCHRIASLLILSGVRITRSFPIRCKPGNGANFGG